MLLLILFQSLKNINTFLTHRLDQNYGQRAVVSQGMIQTPTWQGRTSGNFHYPRTGEEMDEGVGEPERDLQL